MNKRSRTVFVSVVAAALVVLPLSASEPTGESRLLTIDDVFRIGRVGDPQISPDGHWIAFAVSTGDLEDDESRSRIWMVPSQGGDAVPLTADGEASSRPRWSPDGKYLAFLSSRDEEKTQVWTLFRKGGEAVQLTDTAQGVKAFEWSPDGKQMVLVLQDPKAEEIEAKEKGDAYEEKTPPPWVVSRLQFKRDYVGYLDSRRTHLYLIDTSSREIKQITSGDYDDSEPVWSPDGKQIAFVSNRTEDPDANYDTDIWVVNADTADKGANQSRISTSRGPDSAPAWSPDGRFIAYTSVTDVDAMLYATAHLAVSPVEGGTSRVLTESIDRMIFQPRFSIDSRSIYFLLEDGGEQNLAKIGIEGGKVERVIRGSQIVVAFQVGPKGEVAAVIAEPHLPAEIFLLQDGQLSQRSFTNEGILDELRLGEVVEVEFPSRDGTPIESFIIKPPDFVEGRRYPAILDIHGGPQSQYDYRFNFEAQLYAANGYVVIQPNPRGSTGYGQEFCLGIWKAWGEPDFEDVMAAVDYAVGIGWADSERLGVTGWSYGGMLTNHVITKTDRFKAAATGASATLYVVNYGHDQYQRWWEQELGLPWNPENRELWEKLSPFNRVENVRTPTLILGGEKDWNVPIINSEQLYIALKRLGVDTELVVYPGEYHGIDTPSHIKDLYERYLSWFARYLKDEAPKINEEVAP